MYGLVHVALRDLASTRLGTEIWKDICHGHNAPEEPVSLETYSDEMTTGMITETAARLGMSVPKFLREFGRHWIIFIMKSDYADIMRFFGRDFRSCVANLDTIHASVGDAMRNARTPRFSVIFSDEKSVEVRYISQRKGLSPFVEGLFSGLLTHFNEPGNVSVLRTTSDHTDFLISLQN